MKKWLYENTPYIGLVLLLIVMLLSVILTRELSVTLGERLSILQLVLSFFAFLAIIITLIITIRTFRKSMAKPKLEVIFSESGKPEISIDIPKEIEATHELKLSVINKGDAITKLFQIDFIVPAILRPRFDAWSATYLGIPSPPLNPPLDMKEDERIISFCSYEKVYCFVNKPARINTLLLGTLAEKYDDYPNEFTITYRIFGDWAETQSGKLKIRVRKHSKEVT